MKNLITIILAFTSCVSIAQTIDSDYRNTIQTYSEVDTLIVPDEIYLGILTDEKDSKEKLDKLEALVISTLSELGINTDEHLKLDNFASYYHSKLFGKDIKQRRKYELKVSTTKEAISAIVALNKLDIGSITLQKTDYSKKDDLMLELRKNAIVKAKKQAVALALPLEQNVGKALMIRDINENDIESQYADLPGGFIYQDMRKIKQELKSAQIELKPIEYKKKLLVHFELK